MRKKVKGWTELQETYMQKMEAIASLLWEGFM
jgi:hypothetical protein